MGSVGAIKMSTRVTPEIFIRGVTVSRPIFGLGIKVSRDQVHDFGQTNRFRVDECHGPISMNWRNVLVQEGDTFLFLVTENKVYQQF